MAADEGRESRSERRLLYTSESARELRGIKCEVLEGVDAVEQMVRDK